MKKTVALLTLVFHLVAAPGNTLAEMACGQDLDGDDYADEAGETGACLESGPEWFCPVGAVDCVASTTFDNPQCPDGGALDPDRDMCQAQAEHVCPVGTQYDRDLDRCASEVACPDGGIFNPVLDRCEKLAANSCPAGYGYDTVRDVCRKEVECSGGALNTAADRCEKAVVWQCPAGYTYNAAQARCEQPPVCAQGNYSTSNDRCVQNATMSCPNGYSYEANRERCEYQPPTCPSGAGYNGATNRCEASPTCATGTYSATADSCLSSGSYPASCPSGYSWNGSDCVQTYTATLSGGVYFGTYKTWCTVGSYWEENGEYHYCSGAGGGYVASSPFAGGTYTTWCSVGSNWEENGMYYYCSGAGGGYVASSPFAGGTYATWCAVGSNWEENGMYYYCSGAGGGYVASSPGTYGGTYSCPSGGTLTGSTCTRTASLTCPSGGTLSGTSCATTSTSAATCPSGTALNGATDRCLAYPTCPGGSFDGTNDVCFTAFTPTCPAGMLFDAAAGACTQAPQCSQGGIFNGTADLCLLSAQSDCGTWSYDAGAARCYSPPVCGQGVYDSSGNECRAGINRDCGSYLWSAPDGNCLLDAQCPADDHARPAVLSTELDRCLSEPRHNCPSGYAYHGLPIAKCEAVPVCQGVSYDPERNGCPTGEVVCPFGSQYACLDAGTGQKQCSPNPCFDLSVPGNDLTELPPEDPMLQNDGAVDEEGNCLGELYVFSGKASRCRPPGLTVGTVNDCCDSDEPALTDSTSGPRINQVVTAIQTVYETAQVGYYAYQISTGAMAAVEVGGQVVVYNMATGTVAASYGAGSAVGTGVVAAQGAAAGGAAAGGTVSAGLSSYTAALLNPTTIAIAIVVMVVMKVLMGSGCDQRDIETALLEDSGYCHFVGTACERKWPAVGCVQKAKRYCCFNSKLARIIQEQGRPQLAAFGPDGGWGLPAEPNCRGFTPEEFQLLDFAQIDLAAYYGDIQADLTQKVQDAQTNVQQKIQQHYEAIR